MTGIYVGVNPENPDGLVDPEDTPHQMSQPDNSPLIGAQVQPGPWLTDDPVKVVKDLVKTWSDQDRMLARYLADVKVNDLRRRGFANVEVQKSQDRDEWRVWAFNGAETMGMNTAAALCRKFTAALLADPPEPDPTPPGPDESHRDQADFARTILTRMLGESEMDGAHLFRRLEDLASTWRRSYACCWVNPQGRRQPVEVEAHPQAQTVQQPFGMMGELPTSEAVLRYVKPDGSFTDDRAQAALQWAPSLERQVYDGRHVRLIPATAMDLWEAQGAMIAEFIPLGKMRRLFPDIFTPMTDEQIKQLQDHPPKARMLLPGETKKEKEAAASLEGDDRLVFTIRAWMDASSEYPEGAYVIIAGLKTMVYRGPWSAPMPEQGQEPLLPPITELRQWHEECVMDIVGPGIESLHQQRAAVRDHTDQMLHRFIFLPTTSLLNEQDIINRERTVLPINPGGAPTQEDVPPLDQGIFQVYEMSKTEMREDLGLSQTAQGLEAGSVTSGRQAFAILGQAQVALSEPRQNLERAYLRWCRIILQQVRAFFTTPQRMSWVGEEEMYAEKRWTGADLGSTRDVQLRAGSLSLLLPVQKVEQLTTMVQAGVPIPPDEFRDIVASGVGPLVGLREEPQRMHIRRQITAWEEGPPEGWAPQPPQMQMTPMGPQAMPVPDPVLSKIFQPTPSDVVPTIAAIRMTELARAMAGQTYHRWPPEWRTGMDQEFERMRQAAGVFTIQEQQQMQAQQAQAQQQAEMQKAAVRQGPPKPQPGTAAGNQQQPEVQDAQQMAGIGGMG
jgi:hypothetical protein